jgi:hypothetical protein
MLRAYGWFSAYGGWGNKEVIFDVSRALRGWFDVWVGMRKMSNQVENVFGHGRLDFSSGVLSGSVDVNPGFATSYKLSIQSD